MNHIAQQQYYRKYVTKKWLELNGFKFSYALSDEEEDVYLHRFPVWLSYGIATLEGEVMISLRAHSQKDTNVDIKINVFSEGTRERFYPFYYVEYGNYEYILQGINTAVNKKIKQLNIQKRRLKK